MCWSRIKTERDSNKPNAQNMATGKKESYLVVVSADALDDSLASTELILALRFLRLIPCAANDISRAFPNNFAVCKNGFVGTRRFETNKRRTPRMLRCVLR